MNDSSFADKAVGADSRPPIIIAEISGKYYHSLDSALETIGAAARTGSAWADTSNMNCRPYDPLIKELSLEVG